MTLLVTALLLAIAAAGWVVYPIFFRRWGLLSDSVAPGLTEREARKRVALAALKDVEYDRAAGKLDDSDYRQMKGRLEIEALEALQAAEEGAKGIGGKEAHTCGFVNPAGSRFCSGCGVGLV
jgi:hypothetical protein